MKRGSARGVNARNRLRDDRERYFASIAQDLLLSGTVQFLTSVGLPRSGIAQKLRVLAEAIEGGSIVPTTNSGELELFAGVCGIAHDWTRSPEYTGRDGEPQALPLRGRSSLAVLIRNRLRRANIERAVRWMSKRGVIQRRGDGRYMLQQRAVFVLARDPLYLEWATNLAIHHLRTAIENWKQVNPNVRQLDRVARVFDLPESEVPKFREFAKRRAESCLEEIDNWLEDHNERKGRKRTVEAGVHVYGYVGSAQNAASVNTHGSQSSRTCM